MLRCCWDEEEQQQAWTEGFVRGDARENVMTYLAVFDI